MKTTESKAAAAASTGAGRSCFARAEAWLQAGKYVGALVSGLPRRNGWTIAEHAGDRSPDRTRRLLNRASWDTFDDQARLHLRGRGLRRLHAAAGVLEQRRQAYVLRVASNFTLTLAAGTKLSCAAATGRLAAARDEREIRSAGKGSKGDRWYAWAWLATASPRHHLLVAAT